LVGILPESERLYSDEERDQNCWPFAFAFKKTTRLRLFRHTK
jgi:hypothetical protein